MNKKYMAIIISLVIVFCSVLLISGCNKEDDSTTASTTVTPETEIALENDLTDGSAEDETITEADKSEPTADDKNASEEVTTEIEAQPPVKVEDTTVEHTSGKDEPVTCDVCGNLVVKDTGKGDLSIGNYCDGQCDEWYGDWELE